MIRLYDDCFRKHGFHASQLLLTADDFRNRARYLNVRNTLLTLFEYNTVPVVNENDTVSVDEIRFGDNDRLAAMLVNLLPAPLLIILSTIDGLYDGDPDLSTTNLINQVEQWDDQLLELVSSKISSGGTGGMASKLQSVKSVTSIGESVIIANGKTDEVLDRVMAAEEIGTVFLAQGNTIPAWKRWIGYTVTPTGKLTLDAGACKALRDDGRSLLAIGVTDVDGQFESGACVAIQNANGQEVARGLTNYSSSECRAIAGKRTDQIRSIWGTLPYAEVIHRDNLVVLG